MKTMSAQGFDWNGLCEEAAIDPNRILDTEARMTTEEYERVLLTAVRLTGDVMFGLHQGNRMSISELGVLGYVLMHSRTLGGAMEATRRYNRTICNGLQLDWGSEGCDLVISFALGGSPHKTSRHCIEEMAASFHKTMLDLSCRAIPLKAVQFIHPSPGYSEEYAAVFGVQPDFGQPRNAIIVHREVMEYRIIGSDARLLSIFSGMAEEAQGKLASGTAITNKLRAWIVECMPTHYPTLKQAAQEMMMSARTLQERLKAENTSYNRLANEVRKELAIRYLAQPHYAIGEIAYLLHFSEPSAFQSAFRRWTDAAPGEFRQRAWSDGTQMQHQA